jgi:hypothetical protein
MKPLIHLAARVAAALLGITLITLAVRDTIGPVFHLLLAALTASPT